MVATLLRLRFRLLANSLRRSTWQLIATVIGAIYGLGVLGLVVAGLIGLAFAPIELTGTILVLGGSAVVLGWILIPLLVTGLDQTLDPQRLAVFPIPIRTLLVGLTVAGVLGVPGIVTGVASLATTISWIRSPLAALAALVMAVVALLTCVVGSRAVTALSSGLAVNRRFREASGVIVFIPLILAGPIVYFAVQAIGDSSDALPLLARILGWTPLGAAWAVPADLAAGDPLPALAKALIALAFLALLALVWRRALGAALVHPPASDRRAVARGRIGWFGRVPETPAGAVMARTLTYWFRDPRYARQLVIVPLIPVLLGFYSSINGTLELLNLSGPIVAFLLSLAIYADISFDGTAFATHLADGVRGRDDRLGRTLALGVIAVPATIVLTVGAAWFNGAWAILPALAGIAFGVLLSGLGLSAVTSARIVVPVPQAGDNPFKSTPGAGFTTALSSFATWGILLVLSLPELVLGIVAIAIGSTLLGWIALVVGLVLGSVLLVLGIRVGGATLDRTAPRLLQQLKAMRGA